MATTSPSDDEIALVGWLHRRAGLGVHPDRAVELAGADDPVSALVATAEQEPIDPWGGATVAGGGDGRRDAVQGYVRHLIESPQPYPDRRTLMLHGWLTSSIADVPPPLMVEQMRLLRRMGGGRFGELLRAVTIDPAMLVYLDGRTSRRGSPNENYGRELLELFALGTGDGGSAPYSEDDVAAAAAALTGWVVDRRSGEARFVPNRHDDQPQTLLGVDGVHDVDSVIDAVVSHPDHPRFVGDRIGREYVGPAAEGLDPGAGPDPDVVVALAAAYTSNDGRIDAVIETALRTAVGLAVDQAGAPPIVSAPITWFVGMVRASGADPRRVIRAARGSFRALDQIPMLPPSVAGWPGGEQWLTTGGLVARANLAALVADATSPDEPVRVSVDDGDLDRLARHLGLLEPFSAPTADAIRSAASPTAALTLAFVSPEYLLT